MKETMLIHQWPTSRQTDFIKNLLGEETEIEPVKGSVISTGIDLYCANLMLTPKQNDPEEMAYLNFYPIEADTYYLQLSFLPECNNRVTDGYKIIQLVFNPSFFHQWSVQLLTGQQPFRFDRSSEQAFTLSTVGKDLLEQLLRDPEKDNNLITALRKQELAISLLRYALEAFLVPDEANKLPACSFLNNSSERDKVLQTQRMILNNLENPLTIKELSRGVGMNECYLKKGFKAMFGKTIHEYQQIQRISKAKEFLAMGSYSINEVAFMMGFGSPSHFSTSFKKITGMKPCELLR
jgi:AraC-like DNA-binding protein